MFTPAERERVHQCVVGWATSDARIVAGAVVGSLAHHPGDRWSDLDLTFAVADGVPIHQVLEAWSDRLVQEFDAVALFDLPSGASIYRVFLLPSCLQFDLSFSPAAQFGAIGPHFRLLFGRAVAKPFVEPSAPRELFGYGAHHAIRARVCIERDRCWQAEFWISAVRDHALSLACGRLGLPAHVGRGFDDLPSDVRTPFIASLVGSLDRAELLRALGHAVEGLLREGAEAGALAVTLAPRLREFVARW